MLQTLRAVDGGRRAAGRILFVVPLPPPPGGATLKGSRLLSGLEDAGWMVRVVRLSRSGSLKRRGESTRLQDLRVGASVVARVLAGIAGSDYVLLAGSDRQLTTLVPMVRFLGTLFRVPVGVHCFGGATDLFLASLSPARRRRALATIRKLDLFMPETNQVLEALRRAAPHAELVELPNFVQDVSTRAEPWLSRRFVFVGHVRREKGVYELLDAFRPIQERAELRVVGPVWPGEEARWESALAACPGATWLGTLPTERVFEELASARALVLPTYYEGEGHSGAILEAFSVGLPVVSTRHRAIPELVTSGANGWLVEPANVGALERALAAVLDASAESIRRLSRGALETAERHSAGRVVGRLSEELTERLRGRR